MSVPFSCSKYFLPACSFSFSYPSLSQSKSFRFIEVLSNNFSFYGSCFGVMSKNSLLTPRLLEFSPLCPSLFYQIYDPFSVNFFIRYKVEVWGSFFWIWMSIYSKIICGKDYPFFTTLPLNLCQKISFLREWKDRLATQRSHLEVTYLTRNLHQNKKGTHKILQ